MEIEKREIAGSKIEFKIKIEWDAVKERIKDAYNKMERFAKIDGFRKGKVPRVIFEARFSKEASDRAIRELVEKTVKEILENENIKPLADPWIENLNFKNESPLSFNMKVEVMPNFEIPDYKNIKIPQKKINIDDKEVMLYLETLRTEKGELKEKEGRIKKDDIAVVDLVSYPPSGKPVKHYGLYIEIGNSSFPEELENELIGMSKNEEKIFEIKMEDTKDKRLAGMAKFKVNVLGVKERVLPKLDDNFAKMVGEGFKNLKTLKERIKESLIKTEERKEKENMKNQMIDELLKRVQFDAPETLVKEEHKRMLLNLLYNLESKNIPFERFLKEQNKTEDEFIKELKKEAEKKTKLLLILEKIANLENISISDREYEEWVEMNFENKAREEALSEKRRKILEADLRIEKTLDFLINNHIWR